MSEVPYVGHPATQSDPAIGAIAITGSAQTFTKRSRGIYVSTAGTIAVVMADGSTASFAGLLAGQVYPFSIYSITSVTSAAGYVLF